MTGNYYMRCIMNRLFRVIGTLAVVVAYSCGVGQASGSDPASIKSLTEVLRGTIGVAAKAAEGCVKLTQEAISSIVNDSGVAFVKVTNSDGSKDTVAVTKTSIAATKALGEQAKASETPIWVYHQLGDLVDCLLRGR
jgi:hypothetical protein